MRYLQFKEYLAWQKLPTLDAVIITADDGVNFRLLKEGKWINGRFDRNIRVDRPTHLQGDGQTHAHVHGRKGNEIVVVNMDGTGSHGTKGKLHSKDMAALQAIGFTPKKGGIVEWTVLENAPQLLLG
jgi:hypothetical protein